VGPGNDPHAAIQAAVHNGVPVDDARTTATNEGGTNQGSMQTKKKAHRMES
jgi:hypothetical protein